MKKMVFMFLLSAALLACSQKQMDQKADHKADVLAKVGGVSITLDDYYNDLQALPPYAKQMFQGEDGREKFLDEIVKKEILYQQALKEGVEKDPKFLRKVEDFKKLTLISELLQKEIMAKAKVSENEVKEYYDKHKQEFAATSQIRASHILVKTEAEAVKVLARLKKGEKFAALAKELSVDKPSAANGGDIGYFSRGQMVPEFERAAVGLKVGETSGPVKTSFGYHIIKVTDKKTGPIVEFDRVKDVIMQRLSAEKQKEAFDAYISDLKKNYKVEINKDVLAKLSPEKDASENPPPAEKPVGRKEAPKK
jgi:peptidyl-prolyl cis-trans isomerase C